MDISMARCPECKHPMKIGRMVCPACDLTLDGEFDVSLLGSLPMEDQLFCIAFLRSHGSIKKMEGLFDISYPTVKNRLNAIVAQLDAAFESPTPNRVVLDRLARGEMSVEEALERLR